MVDKLRFTFDSREYDFEFNMSIADAIFIYEKARVSVADLFAQLDRRDPNAVAAFVYVQRRANGEAVTWDDMLKSNIFSFNWIPIPESEEGAAAPEEETKRADKVGPTLRGGKTPKSAT